MFKLASRFVSGASVASAIEYGMATNFAKLQRVAFLLSHLRTSFEGMLARSKRGFP